jgi:hypothetical protein
MVMNGLWRQIVLAGIIVLGVSSSRDARARGTGDWRSSGHVSSRAAFQFALIGDTRYNPEGDAQFPPLRAAINNDNKINFTVHVGDLTGSTPCTDDLYTSRYADFQAFRQAVVYTPGDNEWTDCHFDSLGLFNPLDRQAKVRQVLFPIAGMTLGGRAFEVRTQADEPGYEKYVENVMFVRGGVVFVTVHMVGSINGMAPWNRPTNGGPVYDVNDTTATPRADRVAEVNERIAAGVYWLNKAFDVAEEIASPGVFIMSQANPGFITRFETAAVPASFVAWQAVIQKRTLAFRKPVVLAHGDTHTSRVDKPLMAPTLTVVPAAPNPARVENFTRVETFGFPDTHWIRVSVDPNTTNVFRFDFEIVEANRRQFAPIP